MLGKKDISRHGEQGQAWNMAYHDFAVSARENSAAAAAAAAYFA